MFQILGIIKYILQCECANQEDIDAFNNANNTGDINQFINNRVLTIPCGVETIYGQIYNYKTKDNIIKAEIPDSVTSIGNKAFYECKNLTSINIPSKVTYIGDYVFYYCKSLTSINIPNKVRYIGRGAFSNCIELLSINIPRSVSIIRRYTFYSCYSLKQIIIRNGITEIEESAFDDCLNLITVVIPDTVTTIKTKAFLKCKKLQCVQITSQSCNIDSWAFFSTDYKNKTSPSQFNKTCEIDIYIDCKNDSSDYHDPNSDKCILEMFVDHYVIENNTKYYYKECPQTHKLFVDDYKQCVSECPNDYIERNNNCILNPCLSPDNFYINQYVFDSKECIEKCDNIWYYQQVNSKSVKICLTDKNNCDSIEVLKKQAGQQCVAKCNDIDKYIQPRDVNNNVCVTKCIENDIQYVYYDNEINGNICTNQTTCKSLGDQYKLYDSNIKECRTDCGNNGDDSAISYVWYQTSGNNSDNICTKQTTCSNSKYSKTNGFGKQIGIQCFANCKDAHYFQKDENATNICIQSCQPNKIWQIYVDNICSNEEKCNAIEIEEKTLKLVKDTTNNQCADNCDTDKVWYNDETDNKCSDQTDCGVAEKDVANYGKMIEITKQCVISCTKVDYYYPQGTADNKCIQNCQTTIDDTTDQIPTMWYQLDNERICTSQIVCSSEQVKYGEGENQKVLKFRESQASQQCVESCGENNVWFVFQSDNQEENMCTQSQICGLSISARYKNLNKNQKQQCVSDCLGKDGDGKEINYVYYYESDEKGNMCTELIVCEIENHESLNKNQKQQCVSDCKGVDGEGKQIDLVWRATKNQGNVCDTVSTCKSENLIEYLIEDTLQCVTQCPQYYEQQNNICILNLCLNPNNFYVANYDDLYFIECVKICTKVWKYYQLNNEFIKVCLNDKTDCTSVQGYRKQAGNQCIDKCMNSDKYKFIKSDSEQCVEQCENNEFIQDMDNKCLVQCSQNDGKQLYQYQDGQNDNVMCTEKSCQQLSTDENKYYIYEMTDNQIYCTLSCDNDQFDDKPYVFISQDQGKCVSQCSDGYKPNYNQQCVEEKQDDNKLQTEQIVGIVIGIIAVVIILVITIICVKKHKQSASKGKEGRQMTSRVVDKV